MSTEYLWTESGARLQLIRAQNRENLHWIFLPGGPGLGSEILTPLTDLLELPGSLWHLDLPGDGSNSRGSFKNWKQGLIEAVQALENVILVGHSRGGMFALATPELQPLLKGLVLMDTAPDKKWKKQFEERIERFPLSRKTEKSEAAYQRKPSNATLRQFVLAGAPYMFKKESLKKGIQSLKNLPYNCKTIQWTEDHFDPIYKARWIPKIPTLILSGEDDLATPLHLFQKKEFQGSHILKREIKNAGHFPWIENPAEVVKAFNDFLTLFRSTDLQHRLSPE